jgi:hypothetical protein
MADGGEMCSAHGARHHLSTLHRDNHVSFFDENDTTRPAAHPLAGMTPIRLSSAANYCMNTPNGGTQSVVEQHEIHIR